MEERRKITTEVLRGMRVKDVDDAYNGWYAGHSEYEWWDSADSTLVEEVLNAAGRRAPCRDLESCEKTVADLLGEEGMAEASKIAEFRNKIAKWPLSVEADKADYHASPVGPDRFCLQPIRTTGFSLVTSDGLKELMKEAAVHVNE